MSDEELNTIRSKVEAAKSGPWSIEYGLGGVDILGADGQSFGGTDDDASWQLAASSRIIIPKLLEEIDRLNHVLVGEQKARTLLLAGMESQAELMDDLKQRIRKEAGNAS